MAPFGAVGTPPAQVDGPVSRVHSTPLSIRLQAPHFLSLYAMMNKPSEMMKAPMTMKIILRSLTRLLIDTVGLGVPDVPVGVADLFQRTDMQFVHLL